MASIARSGSVYLCGPITGCTFEECKFGWREQVDEELAPLGIECYSPMRAKVAEDFSDEAQESMSPMGSGLNVLSTPRGLTERDRFDTLRSDLIFCNLLGTEKISAGSMIEFGWADALRIPIILVMEDEGNVHDHAMVRAMASWIVPTLEEGIMVARAVLTPGI